MRSTAWILGLAAAWAVAAAPADRLQPPADPPPQPDDRGALRVRLERRLEQVRRDEERLTQALEKLEAGEPLEEVRGAAEGPRDGPRGRPGPGRRGAGGPRPDGPPPPGGPPPQGRVDPHAIMEFIRAHTPELAARLDELRRRDPQAADRLMERLQGRVREVLSERDPALREARTAEFRHMPRMFEVSRRFTQAIRRGAPEAEAAAARTALRSAIGEQFDLRLKRHQAEISVLEERVTRIRREVEDYTTRREQVIDAALERAEKRAREPERDGDAPDAPPGP